jgi:hypothetical protein
MASEELPDYCFYFHWGAVRFSLRSKTAILLWAGAISAIFTGLNWQKLLALL